MRLSFGCRQNKNLVHLVCGLPLTDADIVSLHKIFTNFGQYHMNCGSVFILITVDHFHVNTLPSLLSTHLHAGLRYICYPPLQKNSLEYALRKISLRKRAPCALVTRNGTHFTSKFLDEWLTSFRSIYMYMLPLVVQF